MNSMKSLSNCKLQLSQNYNKIFYNLYGNRKDPNLDKEKWS